MQSFDSDMSMYNKHFLNSAQSTNIIMALVQ